MRFEAVQRSGMELRVIARRGRTNRAGCPSDRDVYRIIQPKNSTARGHSKHARAINRPELEVAYQAARMASGKHSRLQECACGREAHRQHGFMRTSRARHLRLTTIGQWRAGQV